MVKTSEELYQERTKRVQDAIQLKVPDRVPVCPNFGFYYWRHARITIRDSFYDYDTAARALKKTLIDLEPDMYMPARMTVLAPGCVFDMLDFRQIKWPGHGVGPNHSFQSVEEEWMRAEDYDAFLEDPSDYIFRTFVPRLYGALEPLAKLPPLRSMMIGFGGVHLTAAFARPEVARALEVLVKAGEETRRWRDIMAASDNEIMAVGFPPFARTILMPPFDVIGDMMRGVRGVMLDMYRQPNKLLAALEKILQMQIQAGVALAKRAQHPVIFMPWDLGGEGIMSLEQFKTFYWPNAKKLCMALIDEGFTPCLFLEGDYTSRLEILADMPKGKVIYHFERTDMFKAKDILGKVACLKGNVPNSILCTGTTQDVRDYCKKLIDIVGKGGGLIMDAGSNIDEAKPENMKAMIDFTKEYGRYR